MDVAERYLVELTHRSLVQVEIRMLGKRWLQFSYCRVHDLIRDLCLLKGKDEDFVNVVDSRDDHSTRLHFSSLTENNATHSRRLAVHLYDGMDRQFLPLYQQNVIRQLRSLLFFNYSRLPLLVDDLKEFTLLRVLSLHNFDLNSGNLVRGIGELVYLRYVGMRGCILDELPTSMGNLRLLKTLGLFVDGVISIPNNVLCRMKQLKHLTLPLEFRVKDAFKKLRLDDAPREVEQINGFNVGTCELDDLVKLTSVRVLHAVTVTSVEDIAMTMNFISLELHDKQYSSL